MVEDRIKTLTSCRLCPRKCGVDRIHGKTGYCGMDGQVRVARAALHIEYSCVVTPQVRQTGNRLSGLAGTAYASLFA